MIYLSIDDSYTKKIKSQGEAVSPGGKTKPPFGKE
jgi:hypothetical protein